jgi:indole-3-glycerol phosphate synthase
MAGSRRFSQAISEGDGISLIVDVHAVEQARSARERGAEAIALHRVLAGLEDLTELPSLWCGSASPEEAIEAGADAFLLAGSDDDELHALHGRALELGLDCVVEVRDEEQLELVLEELDPEILLLTGDESESALSLLPDVPAGKLAIADGRGASSGEIDELERAGVDAVLVGDAPPET